MRAVIAGVAVLVAAAVLVVVLSGSEPRRAGTDNVLAEGVAVRLAAGERVCQAAGVPDDAARVALAGAPAAGGVEAARLTATVERDGRAVARGRSAGVLESRRIDVPLSPVPPAGPAELCVGNDGDQPLTLLGAPNVFSVDFYRAGEESWWELAPAIADRFAYGKSGFAGAWALWLALAAVAAAWLGAWRALRRDEA